MTCRELIELLIDYVSDELPPDRRQHLDEHLRRCPPCLAYMETYRLTIRLTRCLPRCAPPPPELMQRLHTAVKTMPPPPPAGGSYA